MLFLLLGCQQSVRILWDSSASDDATGRPDLGSVEAAADGLAPEDLPAWRLVWGPNAPGTRQYDCLTLGACAGVDRLGADSVALPLGYIVAYSSKAQSYQGISSTRAGQVPAEAIRLARANVGDRGLVVVGEFLQSDDGETSSGYAVPTWVAENPSFQADLRRVALELADAAEAEGADGLIPLGEADRTLGSHPVSAAFGDALLPELRARFSGTLGWVYGMLDPAWAKNDGGGTGWDLVGMNLSPVGNEDLEAFGARAEDRVEALGNLCVSRRAAVCQLTQVGLWGAAFTQSGGGVAWGEDANAAKAFSVAISAATQRLDGFGVFEGPIAYDAPDVWSLSDHVETRKAIEVGWATPAG